MNAKYIKWFENEQTQFGTKVALQNLLIDLGYELMKRADPTITGFSLRRAPKAKAKTKAQTP